ncbi:hypothetical protein CAEBREN_13574 [Caenorhabditis brenneri]|uniref:Wilms tumor protein homolog n=1 Tax=Caenorhabditis brenneri TaxID=135651 RepID=G0N2K2_CAEBE|nr:hypothetical protein CAEBREN_13574 [Caenorhabditis brenneri]
MNPFFPGLNFPMFNPNSMILMYPNLFPSTLTTSGVQCLWEMSGRVCQEWYQNPDELAGHLNEVHIPRENKVTCYWTNCDRAGKPFKKRSELVNHVRVHTGETPFQCDVCRRRFARAQNLQLHRRSHTGEKRFACPVEGCSKRYTCSSSLSKHKITHIERAPVHCKRCHSSIVKAPTPCAQSSETASFQINFQHS